MYDMLARGPVSVGVNADDWSSYTGGIMDASEADCNPDGINHAVALVAYTEGGETMEEVTTTTTTPDMYYLTSCAYASYWEWYYMGCYDPERLYYRGYCCTYYMVPGETTTTTEMVGSSESTWTIQNSWSAGWGEDGMVRLAVKEGGGVCGVNVIVEQIDMAEQ